MWSLVDGGRFARRHGSCIFVYSISIKDYAFLRSHKSPLEADVSSF